MIDPVQVILFGSWTPDHTRPDSDLDLSVVLPKVEHKRKMVIQVGNELSNLPISKDIIEVFPEEIEKRGRAVGNTPDVTKL